MTEKEIIDTLKNHTEVWKIAEETLKTFLKYIQIHLENHEKNIFSIAYKTIGFIPTKHFDWHIREMEDIDEYSKIYYTIDEYNNYHGFVKLPLKMLTKTEKVIDRCARMFLYKLYKEHENMLRLEKKAKKRITFS